MIISAYNQTLKKEEKGSVKTAGDDRISLLRREIKPWQEMKVDTPRQDGFFIDGPPWWMYPEYTDVSKRGVWFGDVNPDWRDNNGRYKLPDIEHNNVVEMTGEVGEVIESHSLKIIVLPQGKQPNIYGNLINTYPEESRLVEIYSENFSSVEANGLNWAYYYKYTEEEGYQWYVGGGMWYTPESFLQLHNYRDKTVGYYLNRRNIKWSNTTATANITISINGKIYQAKDIFPQYGVAEVSLVDGSENAIGVLKVANDQTWDFDFYSSGGDGWVSDWNSSSAVIIADENHGEDLEKLFDFYIEDWITQEDNTTNYRYDLHIPHNILIQREDNTTINCGKYTNKGYLMGLPDSELLGLNFSVEDSIEDSKIYATIKSSNQEYNDKTIYLKYDPETPEGVSSYPCSPIFMQGILPLENNTFLIVRTADNAALIDGVFKYQKGSSAICAFKCEYNPETWRLYGFNWNNMVERDDYYLRFLPLEADDLEVVLKVPSQENIVEDFLSNYVCQIWTKDNFQAKNLEGFDVFYCENDFLLNLPETTALEQTIGPTFKIEGARGRFVYDGERWGGTVVNNDKQYGFLLIGDNCIFDFDTGEETAAVGKSYFILMAMTFPPPSDSLAALPDDFILTMRLPNNYNVTGEKITESGVFPAFLGDRQVGSIEVETQSKGNYRTMYFNAADFTAATIEDFSGYYVNNDFLFGIKPPFEGATDERNIAAKINGIDVVFTCDLPESDAMLQAGVEIGDIGYVCMIHDHAKIVDGAWEAATGESYMVVLAIVDNSPTTIPNNFMLSMPVPRFAIESEIAEDKTPTVDDIVSGKEAWANGVKIIGEGTAGGSGDYGYKRVIGVPDIEAIINDAESINYGGVMDTRYVSDLRSGLVFLLSEDCPTLTVEVKIDGVLLPQDGNYQVHIGTPDYVVFVDGKQPTGEQVTTIEYNYTTYYPMYILCDYANYIEKTYTKTGTGVATVADAYIFSDAPTTLEVGASVTHTWDVTKDFTTVEGWGCRWIMMYGVFATKESARIELFNFNSTFECVVKDLKFQSGSFFWGHVYGTNYSLKYLKIGALTRLHYSHSNGFCRKCLALQEVIIEGYRNSTSSTNSKYFFAECPALEVLKISDSYIGNEGSNFLEGTYSLKTIKFGGILSAEIRYLDSLRYFELPETLTPMYNVVPSRAFYIKLYSGFNVSGMDFTGYASTGYTKAIQWFYDLADWLYDRSGDTAGSLVIGADNLAILNSLYLEDGVTPLTSIYDAKNWTRS